MEIKLTWLDKAAKESKNVTMGVPWHLGELQVEELKMLECRGNTTALQSWPMAYWPDGSLKWTGHAMVIDPGSKELYLQKNKKINPNSQPLLAQEKYNGILVDNGSIKLFFPKQGQELISWIRFSHSKQMEKACAEHIALELVDFKKEKFIANIKEVILEENGQTKTSIKIISHIWDADKKAVCECISRFIIYQKSLEIEVVHTLILLSEQPILSASLVGTIELEGQGYNRHVAFSTGEEMYVEAAQSLLSRRFCHNNNDYQKQCQGQFVQQEPETEILFEHASQNAYWNNFSLHQDSAHHFYLEKQTQGTCGIIDVLEAEQSKGVAFVGGTRSGLSIGIEDFWQKHPASLKIKNLHQKNTIWQACFWNNQIRQKDFSAYSQQSHVISAYEGFEENRSTAVGIGNTSRMKLKIWFPHPSLTALQVWAEEVQVPSRLICSPERYCSTKALGIFSLPHGKTRLSLYLEEQLADLFAFFQQEIKQRNWYGFWNYGDVMHTYDPYRHQWRYDLGGYAWQNTELVPNMWLWQYFLRTGRSDVFYMAEAMTRHTSEVDIYHAGEYQGLGSRHNVLHWGCPCKEVRISMAGLHRYYYYLTGDERTSDILQEVKDNEWSLEKLPPLREFYPTEKGLIPIRTGPDWAALVSNWFTQWERTLDPEYLEKIKIGIEDIGQSPYQLLSGPSFLFSPVTKKLTYMGVGNESGYHMVICFGGPQVWLELMESLEREDFKAMLADLGKFYGLSSEEKEKQSQNLLSDQQFSWPMFAAGIMAFGAFYYQDKALAIKAWKVLLDQKISGFPLPIKSSIQPISLGYAKQEIPWISTNCASQWSLNVILCLKLIPEYLEDCGLENILE